MWAANTVKLPYTTSRLSAVQLAGGDSPEGGSGAVHGSPGVSLYGTMFVISAAFSAGVLLLLGTVGGDGTGNLSPGR